jgi:threonine/homoserine/homoserine lactone efflux protein
MPDLDTLTVFIFAVLALLMSPGPNMAFIFTYGTAYGVLGGFAVALGIASADVILAILTASGLTALVTAWPPSLNIIRYAGVAYLAWLALQAITSKSKLEVGKAKGLKLAVLFRMGLFNCLLNPKALLFFMLFLPQFVTPEKGNVALQLFVLGIVLAFIGLVFHSLLGMFSGALQKQLAMHSKFSKYQGWLLAAVLFGLAIRLLLTDPTTVAKKI